MEAKDLLEGKNRSEIGAAAANCLHEVDADDVDTTFIEGISPEAAGYVPNDRIDELRDLVNERMGDEWGLVLPFGVEDCGETMVSVEK